MVRATFSLESIYITDISYSLLHLLYNFQPYVLGSSIYPKGYSDEFKLQAAFKLIEIGTIFHFEFRERTYLYTYTYCQMTLPNYFISFI